MSRKSAEGAVVRYVPHVAATHCCNTWLQHTAATRCCSGEDTVVRHVPHIAATRCCNMLLQHVAATRCRNTLLQHTTHDIHFIRAAEAEAFLGRAGAFVPADFAEREHN